MRSITTTFVGNITQNPKLITTEKGGNIVSFSVAVNTVEKNMQGEYITNFYEVSWFAPKTIADKFMQNATTGTKVWATGYSWMYDYKSKNSDIIKQGLKLRASDVQILAPSARSSGAASHAAAADDDYADL